MKQDSRLSSVLHVLMHMAHSAQPLTSEALARALGTHAVVVRRTLSSLREQGYVASTKGHGGGWTIACDLRAVSLLDIYRAVGEPTMFAMGNRIDHPQCLVEQAVNDKLDGAFADAEALLVARLQQVTLADLADDFNHRMKHRRTTLCEKAPR